MDGKTTSPAAFAHIRGLGCTVYDVDRGTNFLLNTNELSCFFPFSLPLFSSDKLPFSAAILRTGEEEEEQDAFLRVLFFLSSASAEIAAKDTDRPHRKRERERVVPARDSPTMRRKLKEENESLATPLHFRASESDRPPNHRRGYNLIFA